MEYREGLLDLAPLNWKTLSQAWTAPGESCYSTNREGIDAVGEDSHGETDKKGCGLLPRRSPCHGISSVANAEQSILFEVYKYHGSRRVPLPNYQIRLFRLRFEGADDHIAYHLVRSGRTDVNGMVRLGGFTDDRWYRLESLAYEEGDPDAVEAISYLYIWAGMGSGIGGYIDAFSGLGGPIKVRVP